MNFEKVEFENKNGYKLSGRLELPVDQAPHNYAVFAHCFTCGKNFSATKNISRALTTAGYGVLRFDFTGLGNSAGDFADSNFSGNVEDLLAAIDFLETHHKAPTLLVGHSLGGAAVIYASAKAKSIKALATIGAPSDTKHVGHLFEDQIADIKEHGEALVNLSGRSFKIKKQFLEDINDKKLTTTLHALKKPILILHSPSDDTVGISHAEKLYHAAIHPKSFVSLDGADHLLMEKADSKYAGEVIAGWSSRYIPLPETDLPQSDSHVVAQLDDETNFTTQMKAGRHYFIADEPVDVGGNDYGPTPYELLSSSLASCTVMTLQMYARRKMWKVENVQCHVNYDRQHAVDCKDCENDENSRVDTFTRVIKITGTLDDKQRDKLLAIADKCPVHRTLHSTTQVITKLGD